MFGGHEQNNWKCENVVGPSPLKFCGSMVCIYMKLKWMHRNVQSSLVNKTRHVKIWWGFLHFNFVEVKVFSSSSTQDDWIQPDPI